MPEKLEVKMDRRQKQIEANQEIGVIPWKNDFEQDTSTVWEVVDGYHRVPPKPGSKDFIRMGPGNRFHPTVKQVEEANAVHPTRGVRGRGGLLRGGHIRELSGTEMAGIGRSKDPSRKVMARGADIGIRALPMSDTALKLALGVLSEDDFEGVEPARSDGAYTVEQIQALVEAKHADSAT